MKASRRREHGFNTILKSKGLRVTAQRVAVLKAMSKVTQPISHSELSDRLASAGLDRVTVYRNLHSLADAGVLVRAQLGDHVRRFELPRAQGADHAHHPHLVCDQCGGVRCLPASAVQLSGEAAQIEVAEIHLRGRCATCVRG